ncbi:glutamate formimidoyltransferase [Gloeobacter kilaueensis]|uniref:glutamate formimidoyltransferase n=1 Tax=Gloeobacter kilaueensis (strain ATCC BAA-2537 / CCAP 1431/1 / ULC 316 / JS1) TaxID=1183438 RepID=U5QNA2_GLOK1|nr:glutamate formimidoyltransferase [Gloeobacter kilaueensis]AGY60467.1 glutamate formiminotransferase [Gloeobacter kilaueensis JS1]
MSQLIECVPNISEGRRAEVIEQFSRELSQVPGVVLLDSSSDLDHNRSVFTLVGSAEGLQQAVVRLYSLALEHIDLRRHQGSHPRMGAVDVVPFIPIRQATMADCVALARSTAEEIARQFDVPVFLYAEAASAPNRRVLSEIRKGEFENLEAKLAQPEWQPDFGPAHPHPTAGASAIGARFFLIAYNLQLSTGDLKIANAIARAVRASSGGLANIQAMGVFLAERNQAQVSMNLLNYEKTPIHRIQELVKIEARRYGVQVTGAEIVGLVPQAALIEAAAYYLQIENWQPSLVLEQAMLDKE